MRVVGLVLALAGCTPESSVVPQTPEVVDETPEVLVEGTTPVASGLVASVVPSTETAPDSWRPQRQTVHAPRSVETHDGVSVQVWSEVSGDTVRLWAKWGQADARVIDGVQTTSAHAAQSGRSLFDVAAAAHGHDQVAVAWRPLVNAADPQLAELRWGVMSGSGTVTWNSESMRAQLLGATTGIGPYAFAESRLRASSIGEEAVFVWVGPAGPQAVRADTAAPIALPMLSSSELHLAGAEDHVLVTGYDYWCDSGTTFSSSCRSMNVVRLDVHN